jgi:signal transduction histidine kinase
VALLAVVRLDDYFAAQERHEDERQSLSTRAASIAYILRVSLARAASPAPVVTPDKVVDADAIAQLQASEFLPALATIGQADIRIRLGQARADPATGLTTLDPASVGPWGARYDGDPEPGQTRQAISSVRVFEVLSTPRWAMEITLANPMTYRATTIRDLTFILVLVAIGALGAALLLGSLLARRFTRSLRRLTEASRGIAEGDLGARVPVGLGGAVEIEALSRQFNRMAAQLEESVEFIRRDRDRSRDFLADVSHELRTPIAALRTFNELLREGAGEDPAARTEFLESSAGQLERLDWLAQNLLDLSKLDSGLVLLDLRPDDLRSAVESAVEQAEALAVRRGISLSAHLPAEPVRIRHDPQRIAQVVGNLIGNALKFTPRGGAVDVEVAPFLDGARIRVTDTGVGIDASELPRIFDRFYRGSLANEARGSGSGLGLAIARSIVDMHEGRIVVESRLGVGSTFTVYLPQDPRSESAVVAPGEMATTAGDPPEPPGPA